MKSKLKQKHIEQFLQDIKDFQFGEKEKIMLQQHLTPPNVCAQLLFYIYEHQPIENYIVADLGSGTGMLLCALIFIGVGYAFGCEIDSKYIQIAKNQLDEKVEGGNYDLILSNVSTLKIRAKSVDMVVMNPPFGTKESGIDIKFLTLAMQICRGNIYSMHKKSTRPFIINFGAEKGYTTQILFTIKFPLKKRFKEYHKKDISYTQVDIFKFSPVK